MCTPSLTISYTSSVLVRARTGTLLLSTILSSVGTTIHTEFQENLKKKLKKQKIIAWYRTYAALYKVV